MEEFTEASDAQLVTHVARYSQAALAELYRRHGGAVFGLASRVLNSRAEAEDVTQEVFVRLWNAPERFDPVRGSLRAYLMTMAHGRAVDVVRALSAARRREAADVARSFSPSPDVAQRAWDAVVSEQVGAALVALPEPERRAIELAYFEGHTYVEVARILDEPEGTIKSRIRSGMRRMRGELERRGVQGVEL